MGDSFQGRLSLTVRAADIPGLSASFWSFDATEARSSISIGGFSYVSPTTAGTLDVALWDNIAVDPRTGQPVSPHLPSAVLVDLYRFESAATEPVLGESYSTSLFRISPDEFPFGFPPPTDVPTLLTDTSLPASVSELRRLLVGGGMFVSRNALPGQAHDLVVGDIEWVAAPIPEPRSGLLALIGASVIALARRRA